MLGGLAISCSPWGSPPLALALGLSYGLTGRGAACASGGVPAHADSGARDVRRWTTWLLQLSVVMLGFGFDLRAVLLAGQRGLVYTAAGIAGALLLGHLLARLLRVDATPALLIGVGTAICGGSAIAAVGPAVAANDEELSVALGTVFILNAAALFLFPAIGAWLALTEPQFGLWAALAIHDTSSVVGAGMRYGPAALATATTVKLARALWIVPVAIGAALLHDGRGRGQDRETSGDSPAGGIAGRSAGGSARDRRWTADTRGESPREARAGAAFTFTFPWFVLGFLAAAGLARLAPQGADAYARFAQAGTLGLSGALFLVGTQLTRATLARVGWRALALGLLLWLVVASVSLWGVTRGFIAL